MERANPPLTAESSVSTHTHSLLNIPPLDQSALCSLGTMASCALSARSLAIRWRRPRNPQRAPRRSLFGNEITPRAAPSLFIVAVKGVAPACGATQCASPVLPTGRTLTKCNQILRRRHVIERCHALARPQSARDVA